MSRRSNTATARLKQDYLRIKRDPIPFALAEPLPSNILEWHYVIRGPENSPYAGGVYHGKLVFPSEFPYKPPSIYMITPTGRFKCNSRLCLSISDFHPEYWNPAWSVSTILTGLLSFMLERNPTLGSIETTDYEKLQFALKSGEFNMRNKIFVDLFPSVVEEIKAEQEKRRREAANVDLDSTAQSVIRQLVQHNRHQELAGSTWTNICVILGFAAFALTVKYVLRSIAQ